jgi:PAT family beta-lactamase induction signal transducer AmpG
MTPTPIPPAVKQHPWRWIPTLYFGQGIPYVVVMTLSVVMYKNLDISNTEIAFYTSWLNLPWVIKPLWSPLVDMFRTKRFWIVTLQFGIGAALAMVALTLPTSKFFQLSLAMFWLMAFSSATHDIAADGFYLLAMERHQQAAFVGVRSTFYRLSMIAGQGGLVYLAGHLQTTLGNVVQAWVYVLILLAVFMALIGAYHVWALPRPAEDRAVRSGRGVLTQFIEVFGAFFRKPAILSILGFLLLYRFAESQLLKLVTPFLLDGREKGGLGLTTQDVGLAYGTAGVIALTLGGLLGGYLISRFGLKRMLWPMVISINVPNLVYVAMGVVQPDQLAVVAGGLVLEQFGYGFGFTAYMVFMMMVAEGEHKTAHYALCTGFMALGMMLPGMPAGWLQDHLGYVNFFIWVCVATIPSFAVAAMVRIEPGFGKKVAEAGE